MEKDLQVVGFRIGRETFGLPIAMVREIVRVPEITSVPNAPDYIEGVINLRGRIIPVVDLRKRFGEKSFGPDKKNRIVVVELRSGEASPIEQPAEVDNVHPAWSPDATRLAFACDRGGNMDLWVHDFRTRADTRLTEERSRERTGVVA